MTFLTFLTAHAFQMGELITKLYKITAPDADEEEPLRYHRLEVTVDLGSQAGKHDECCG